MSVQFNQSAVEAWVALCEEEGELKRQGASAEVLEAIRIRVAKALVAIIQEAQSNALLEQILGNAPQPQVAETTVLEDPSVN
jgi:hypothetical protein